MNKSKYNTEDYNVQNEFLKISSEDADGLM